MFFVPVVDHLVDDEPRVLLLEDGNNGVEVARPLPLGDVRHARGEIKIATLIEL